MALDVLEDGIVNQVLGPLAPNPSWLVNRFWAMPIIALFATWKQLGFYVLLYLAAMQNIPHELYEAAEIDGAGTLQRFRSVTVPGVRQTTTLVVIVAFIVGANFFTEPYLLTGGGGPNGASMSPVLLMYQKGIEQGNAGIGAAIGVMLAALVMICRPSSTGCRGGIDGGVDPRSRRDPNRGRRTQRPGNNNRRLGRPRKTNHPGRILSLVLLLIGALVFLFPFWYMVVGAFQLKPDPTVAGAFPDPSTLTVDNFIAINERLNLLVTLRNSLIFTLGVIVSTLVLGLLAGYALAVLNFRGRGRSSGSSFSA